MTNRRQASGENAQASRDVGESLRYRLQQRPSVPCAPESPREAVGEMAVPAGDKIKDLSTLCFHQGEANGLLCDIYERLISNNSHYGNANETQDVTSPHTSSEWLKLKRRKIPNPGEGVG